MGVSFSDPDLEIHDVVWYNLLSIEMRDSVIRNDGLISVDKELGTFSAYVELHRKS